MRLAVPSIPGNLRRNPLVVYAFLVLVTASAYQLAQYIIRDDLTGIAYGALIFAGVALLVLILNNWRRGLYFFLAWLLFEDFARKYLGNNMAIYFAKDFLLLVIYLSFFNSWRRKEAASFRPPFLVPLVLFVWFGFLQIFNSSSPHIVYGLLGFKVYLYYIPLLFVGYALINSEVELRRFFFVNLVAATAVVSLGIAQSILGHTFLNPLNIAEEIRELSTNYRVSPFSGLMLYRPTSVFVSAGRFANFLLVVWLLVFGFSGYLLLRHRRGRALAFTVLALTAAGTALCGQRSIVLWSAGSALAGVLAFIWGAPWRQREVVRVLRTAQRAAIGVAIGISLLLLFFPDALLSRIAFYEETLSPSSSASQLQNRTWNYPVENFLGAFTYERWPYGYGIGTCSLGVQYVTKFFHVKPPVLGVESGFGTLVVEMGIGGLLLWFVMAFAIVLSAWRVVKSLRGSPWFPIGFMIFWYAGLLLFPMTFSGIQPYQDFVLNAFLWLLLGILFRLPTLAVSAQFAAIQPDFQFQPSMQQALRQPLHQLPHEPRTH